MTSADSLVKWLLVKKISNVKSIWSKDYFGEELPEFDCSRSGLYSSTGMAGPKTLLKLEIKTRLWLCCEGGSADFAFQSCLHHIKSVLGSNSLNNTQRESKCLFR